LSSYIWYRNSRPNDVDRNGIVLPKTDYTCARLIVFFKDTNPSGSLVPARRCYRTTGQNFEVKNTKPFCGAVCEQLKTSRVPDIAMERDLWGYVSLELLTYHPSSMTSC